MRSQKKAKEISKIKKNWKEGRGEKKETPIQHKQYLYIAYFNVVSCV